VIVGVVGVVAPCIPPITAPATHPVASHFAAPVTIFVALFLSPESQFPILLMIPPNGFDGAVGVGIVGVVVVVGFLMPDPIHDESMLLLAV
jgi:hypothetical protein